MNHLYLWFVTQGELFLIKKEVNKMKMKILFGIFATVFAVSSAFAEEALDTTSADTLANTPVNKRNDAKNSKNIPAVARISMTGAAKIRSSTASEAITTITPKVEIEDIECDIGEYPKLGKCVTCEQKNNPGVKWANSGKDCKITECISDEYVLIDKDKDQPKCLQKCNVWGGVATREWVRDEAEFSFCGSGKYLECDKGFAKTREQTSSSGTEFGHCIVEGTMTGACKNDGDMNPGKFENGLCMQVCENGFWSTCSLQKFCKTGYEQDNLRDVIFVKDKTDSKTSVYDCVETEEE